MSGRNLNYAEEMNYEEETRWYEAEVRRVLGLLGREEAGRLFSYVYCELDCTFIGFLENYADLTERIPKDFTILDIGCYQAFQAVYFTDHISYIGVEPFVPVDNRARQENASYYKQSAQEFVRLTLPELTKNGLDLEKTFAIASAVPDKEVWSLIEEHFPYYRIAYPGEPTKENLPERIVLLTAEQRLGMEKDMEQDTELEL